MAFVLVCNIKLYNFKESKLIYIKYIDIDEVVLPHIVLFEFN